MGFGKSSGPNAPPDQTYKFGNFPQSRSPSPPAARSPRNLGAFETLDGPPSAFESGHPILHPSQLSPGMLRAPSQSPLWNTEQNYYHKSYSSQPRPRLPNVVITSRISPAGTPAKASHAQDFRSTRTPAFFDEEPLRKSRSVNVSRAGLPSKSDMVPWQMLSPPLDFESKSLGVGTHPPFNEAELHAASVPIWGNQSKSFTAGSFIEPLTQPVISSVYTSKGTQNSVRKAPISYADIQAPKRSRSPTLHSSNDTPLEDATALYNSQRPSGSPPKMRSNNHSSQKFQPSSTSLEHYNKEVSKRPMSSPVAKKSKLPSSSEQVIQEEAITRQDEKNRELEAKAKRLARFKDELNEPMQNDLNVKDQKSPVKRQHLVMVERRKLSGDLAVELVANSSNSNVPSDYDATDSSTIITGSCLDMCPESERAERERKGDLDKYERLDGDRNQTSESLAVKKYNRTAEREAELIRPMPILQKTMDYLLNLLNRPYDDNFLGLYNFLWDRMRAIRMDLRMQHIFGQGAIKMLEQMIRLHIIAMHELCEYTKGEGFSEGFDAHLNIEQMNKTSVELFQLYDDHRKNGVNIVTEKEFRGYYALLKLDKHPGYKVEPAELSLDLAKMTPEMRQTPEVVFARDVARACRMGNFIAFFRLAREASYIQACLMHAHFAKLRTQALAALHGGLQNNQGIPVADVAYWLGMEEEDVEELLEYHGFSIKDFEAPFMVKEGPFLNVDSDYPVKCSILVHQKKSKTIVEDVKHPHLAKSSPETAIGFLLNEGIEQTAGPIKTVEDDSFQAVDEDMPDYTTSVKDGMELIPTNIASANQIGVFEDKLSPMSPSIQHSSLFYDSHKSKLSSFGSSPRSQLTRIGSGGKSKYDARFRNSLDRSGLVDMKGTPSNIASEQVEKDSFQVPLAPFDPDLQNGGPDHVPSEEMEDQWVATRETKADEMDTASYDQEVAEAKLKLILRIWKRCSSRKRELREQKRLAANAALTSLSLGLPIRQPEIQSSTYGEFNLDFFLSKRHAVQEKTWSRLNVSEVVAATLAAKNPNSKCICWKVLLFTEEEGSCGNNFGKREVAYLKASSWLRSKLVPTRVDDEDAADLALSSPGLSIWKKWYHTKSSDEWTFHLTVVREAKLENLNEVGGGSSAILFLVSESIPWQFQRNRLQSILMSLNFGSHLPLLILTDSCKNNVDASTITKELGLLEIDRSRFGTFSVAFLKDQQTGSSNMFFSDEQLREGLQWLVNELPPQPVVSWMKTRELVLFHLNSSLEVLRCKDVHKVGPNDCICTFNQALDQALWKVNAAVNANPTSWPCPEIALLYKFGNEYEVVSQCLPDSGWSSATRIEPLISGLTNSKLPPFEEDISWLYSGADGGCGIETQKLKLQNCLIKYLTETSEMMVLPVSTEESYLMLQKFARLELHNSTYYLVPHWAMIFQRVFHWRLMDVSNSAFSSAYILSHDYDSIVASGLLDKTDICMPLSSPLVYPSLDEMVEIGCISPIQRMQQLDYEGSFPHSGNEITDAINEVQMGGEDTWKVEQVGEVVREGACTAIEADNGSGSASTTKATEEADRLSQLLAKCNILQNMIQEKLSIYY